jgi:hypothetical protein
VRALDVRSGKTGVTTFPRPSARTPPDSPPDGVLLWRCSGYVDRPGKGKSSPAPRPAAVERRARTCHNAGCRARHGQYHPIKKRRVV